MDPQTSAQAAQAAIAAQTAQAATDAVSRSTFYVDTSGIPAGAAAHRLYHRHGFVVVAAGPVNPAGYATDVMQRAAICHS